MNTVEPTCVWTHESAGYVPWTDDDMDGMSQVVAWLSGCVEVSVWKEPTGFYAWCVTIWSGRYPFNRDDELEARTGYVEQWEAKWDAIRRADRWLCLQEAEDGLMELLYTEQARAEQGFTDDERRFDHMEHAGREEPHADLQRSD